MRTSCVNCSNTRASHTHTIATVGGVCRRMPTADDVDCHSEADIVHDDWAGYGCIYMTDDGFRDLRIRCGHVFVKVIKRCNENQMHNRQVLLSH